MSILNRPSDGLLSALIALWRAVCAYGPTSEDELLGLVAPPTLETGRYALATKTLKRWTQLGFFVERDGRIHLSEPVAELAPNDLDGCRTAVLRLLLKPSNSQDVETEEDANDTSMASDCVRAMAWALAQDPFVFPANYGAADALQIQQEVVPRPFVNDTRWAGFVEWGSFLGAGFKASRAGFVPVPSFAVRAVLPTMFGDERVIPQSEFFRRLADALPIVDGGSSRLLMSGQTARPWRVELDSEVSPTLSAALMTLEASGVLRLRERSDAPQRMLLGRAGRPLHQVSHIEHLESRRV